MVTSLHQLRLCTLLGCLWITFLGAPVAGEEEEAQEALATSQVSPRANLADDKTVSLVAVAKNGAPAQEGWQPNGHKLIDVAKWPPAVMLFCGDQAATKAPPGVAVEDDARDLLFEFKGLRRVPSIVVQSPGYFGVCLPEPLHQPYRLRVATRVQHEPYVAGTAYEPTATTFRVGLTDEPWGTWLIVGPDGKFINRVDGDDPEIWSYALIEVLRIAGTDSEPLLVLRQPISKMFDLQVRCFDSFGNEYYIIERASHRVGKLTVKESEFATSQPLARGSTLARFEYRLRRYRHWVTFENVSLHAGRVTDVKCRIDKPLRGKSGIDVEAGGNSGSAATASQNKQKQSEDQLRSEVEFRLSEPTEIVLSMDSLAFMLDLDTGKTMDPPATSRPEQKQMDIYPNQVQPYHYPTALNGVDLEGIEVKASDWNASAAEVRRTLAGKGVGLLKELDIGPGKNPTYFFKTRTATEGILQIVGIAHEPKGIRLRYKTLTAVPAETPPANVQTPSAADGAKDPAPPVAEGPAPEFGLGERQDLVQWSHDSQRLYATGDFHKLTVWERNDTDWKAQTLAAKHHANSLVASRKSPLLVAGTNVGTAEVWNVKTRTRNNELRSSPDHSVYAVAISTDDNLVAACGTNGTVVVFDREMSKLIATLGDKADTRMASLSFAPDGKTLAALDRYGHLVLWNLSNGTQLAEWQGVGGEDCSIYWSTDGKQLAISGWGSVTLIATEKGSQPRVVEAPEAVLSRHPEDDGLPRSGPEPGGIKFASVTAIAPDLRTAASVAPDASIGIWDLATRKIAQTLPAPTKVAIMDAPSAGLHNLTFSPNGQRLACTTLRGEVVFWQVAQAAMDKQGRFGPAAQPSSTELLAYRSLGQWRLESMPIDGDKAVSVAYFDSFVKHLPAEVRASADRRFNDSVRKIDAARAIDDASVEQFDAVVNRIISDSRDLPAVYRAALMCNLMMVTHEWLGRMQFGHAGFDGTLFERIKNKCAMAGLAQADEIPVGLALRLVEFATWSQLTLNTDDDPEWPGDRRAKAALWLKLMENIRRTLDPRWDAKNTPRLEADSPGPLPEAIRDPKERAEYIAQLEEYSRQQERYTQQVQARRLLAELYPRMEADLIRLYVRKPFNLAELQDLLERYAADDTQRDRVARSVRLFNTIVPSGTHLKYGWPDALAEAGSAGVPALMAAVGDKSYPSFVRYDGAWALGLIGDPRAIEALTAVAEDKATPAKYQDIARAFVRTLKEKASQAAPPNEAADEGDAKEAVAPLPDLRLTGGEVTPEAISKLAERHWGTITLADAQLTGEIVERLRHAGSIRQLRLFGAGLSGQIPRLKHVTGLTGLEIDAPFTGHDLDAIGQLTQLERLSLPQELTINVSGAHEIARLVRLKSLRLYNVNIDDAAFAALRTLVDLEELDLTHTRITDEGLKTIETMPRLRVLELHRHPDWYLKQQLTDACLASVAHLPALERLSLSGKITNDGLKQVGKCPNLKSLSLLNTEITGAGLEALEGSNIEHLTVGAQQLDDEPSTLEHLKKCRKLKGIHVIGKPTGKESWLQERLPDLDWSFTS